MLSHDDAVAGTNNQLLNGWPVQNFNSTGQEEENNDGSMNEPTLTERIREFAPLQAMRLAGLTGHAEAIATEGIIRHLAACDRHNVPPDTSAIREIIDDALNGKRIYAKVV